MKKNPQMSPENTCNALVCIVSFKFIIKTSIIKRNSIKKNDINIKILNKKSTDVSGEHIAMHWPVLSISHL